MSAVGTVIWNRTIRQQNTLMMGLITMVDFNLRAMDKVWNETGAWYHVGENNSSVLNVPMGNDRTQI